MKKIYKFLFAVICVSLSSCDTSMAVLQGLSDGLNGYGTTTNSYYSQPVSNYQPTTSSTSQKEWHNCSSCNGSGNCKYCGGSGKDAYTRNGRCGVCRGTGKCAGCNGKGGWKI